MNHPRQDSFTFKIQQHFSRQARAAHSSLNDGNCFQIALLDRRELICFFSIGTLYQHSSFRDKEGAVPEPIANPDSAPDSAVRNPSSTKAHCGCDSSLPSLRERSTPCPRCN